MTEAIGIGLEEKTLNIQVQPMMKEVFIWNTKLKSLQKVLTCELQTSSSRGMVRDCKGSSNLSFERWGGERGSEARDGIEENARIHRRADAYKNSEKLLEYQ